MPITTEEVERESKPAARAGRAFLHRPSGSNWRRYFNMYEAAQRLRGLVKFHDKTADRRSGGKLSRSPERADPNLLPLKSKASRPRSDEYIVPMKEVFTGQVVRIWPNGFAAICVQSPAVGWFEFDAAPGSLPVGARPGDRFDVRLKLDANNNVLSYQIPPHTKILPRATESVGEGLTKDMPKVPSNWEDKEAVARYEEELEAWNKNSGLK